MRLCTDPNIVNVPNESDLSATKPGVKIRIYTRADQFRDISRSVRAYRDSNSLAILPLSQSEVETIEIHVLGVEFSCLLGDVLAVKGP